MKIDNENVRLSNRCPLCEGYKEIGLVTCWPCYQLHGLRYGNPLAEAKIERANEEKGGVKP
jgi:hypothetical protein